MSRPAPAVSGKNLRCVFVIAALFVALSASAFAQYPGTVHKDANAGPTLRATGIYEWTGDFAKPNASRLIPIAVWDGQQYQPGGLYMAQPAPLTVLTGTVYELEKDGVSRGLFNVKSAENLNGSWIGIGSIQPHVAVVKIHPPMSKHPPQVVKDVDPDKPTLHRKDSSDTTSSSAGSTTSPPATASGSTSDPDRPTLHRRDASDTNSGSTTGNSGDNSGSAQSEPSIDPDRPTLHKRSEASSNPSGAPVTAVTNIDPDRPTLRYGKPETQEGIVEPSKLEGIPANLNQMVAISDARPSELHAYAYSWADPADAQKMKAAMEELAQKAIADTQPGAQASAAKTTAKASAKRRKIATKSAPLPMLDDEKFNAFELSYSGGATLVFTAKTAGIGDAVKYVTLIAQPDFYGVPQVLFKQVTSGDRLDIIPRMRLVDVADTDGDRRAELIFELRGTTTRAFAIYSVVNREVDQAFNTGPLP
jgi:hypothetical protein